MDSKEIVLEAARFLDEKKAGDVVVIHVGPKTPIADYFVIADGEVDLQLDSLRAQLHEHLLQKGFRPRNGLRDGQGGWVLLDYTDFVIHLFLKETREFYNLESIWGECEVVRPGR